MSNFYTLIIMIHAIRIFSLSIVPFKGRNLELLMLDCQMVSMLPVELVSAGKSRVSLGQFFTASVWLVAAELGKVYKTKLVCLVLLAV